jgi:GNAT superfamily N-acetyltransferase
MVTVADCERVQTNWYRTRARLLGGEAWTDGPLMWVDGPDGPNLMFPRALPAPQLRRGVDRARDLGRSLIGAWLSLDVDPAPLREAGFDRGWSPWWMTADLAAVAGPGDSRIELQSSREDHELGYKMDRDELPLARLRPARAWYAAAYTRKAHRLAGRAWSFLDGDLAGVFNMFVREKSRRHGLGTGLLRAVCAEASAAGAHSAVLNATAEGKLLYSSCGFTQIGEGITWWRHLP